MKELKARNSADGIEPLVGAADNQTTSSVQGHTQASDHQAGNGGGGRNRTDDLMLAKHALSQLSYAPFAPALAWQGKNDPVDRF